MKDSLEQVAAEVRACTRCPLHQTRGHAVPGEGSARPGGLLFIGEAPGADEDASGRPFVGRSGQLLRTLLAAAGVDVATAAFITNTVRCRPPENRVPLAQAVRACAPYLTRQLKLLAPALVVPLGAQALAQFVPGVKITHVHGTVLWAAAQAVYPCFHPVAALRDPRRLADLAHDLQALPEILARVSG